MTEPLSYDEDAREAELSARMIEKYPVSAQHAIDMQRIGRPLNVPWPICGDELTKRGMK